MQTIYSNPPKLCIVEVEYSREYNSFSGFSSLHFSLPTLNQMQLPDYEILTIKESIANALSAMLQADENHFKQASKNFLSLAEKKLKSLITAHLSAYKEAYFKAEGIKSDTEEMLKKMEIKKQNYSDRDLHPEWYETLSNRRKGIIRELDKIPTPEQEVKRCEQVLQDWIKEHQAFETFIREFRDFILALAKEPITIGSGQYKQRKRTQVTYITHESEKITIPRKTILHPQPTEQEMWNEMVRELQDLPRWRAYCRMVKEVDGEQVVLKYKLFPFPLPQADSKSVVQDRIDRIIARTRLHYCTPRKQVEEEIKARKEALTKPLKKQARAKPGDEGKVPQLTLAQLDKLNKIKAVLGDKEYDRFYNDPSVQHKDNLARLLEKDVDAKDIKHQLESWRAAGSPANVSPFAELVKTLLG